MIKYLLIPCLALVVSYTASADNKDCSFNCFNTAITSMETTEDGCYNYTLNVSYSGQCTFELSHFSVETSCGTVTALNNSENWPQEIGIKDPSTGITGFKIDDIKEFGKSGPKSFTVNVTLCPDDNSCANTLSCWTPVVAYKAGQCVAYDSLSYQCSKLNASLIAKDPTCADNGNNGSIDIVIEDGEGPFTYSWSTGDTTKHLNGLNAGKYSVTIYDAHGDTLNLSTELNAPSPISFTYEVSNASCDGKSDGAISVNATGGAGSFTYSWSNGSTGNIITDLAPGQYEVTATDVSGCSESKIFYVESINQIMIQAQVVKSNCSEDTGAIDLVVTGGSGNYTFQWLDGATTQNREGLSPGFYNVTVTDEKGCQSSRTFSVKTNNTLSINSAIIPTGCPEDNTGGVDISVSGATGNLSYLWSTGEETANLSGVGAGKYELTVTDEAGCTLSKNFYVFAESIAVQTVIDHASCYGAADGSILLTSDEEIKVEWSNGATTAEISGLSEGLYTATISNADGCTNTLSYFIDAPDPISFIYSIKNETCEANNYTASLSLDGGTAPYDIGWSDGGNGADRENLSAGTYTVSITDINGCQTSGNIVVETPESECPDNPDADNDPIPDDSSEDTTDDGNEPVDESEDTTDTNEDPATDGSSEEDGGSEGAEDEENPDNEENKNGDEDTNNSPAVGEASCGDPFDIELTLSETGDCLKYSGIITYSGEKSFGLSHAVISTSCGEINGIYTEVGKFETGNDPTTEIKGLKIDDISGFGEENKEDQMFFEFNLCNLKCENSESVSFVVAYKYGQCTEYDTVTVDIPQAKTSATAYPNPASGKINFYYDIPANEYIEVELYNKLGLKVRTKYFRAGEQLQLDIYNLPNDMYTYRIISSRDVVNGKIMVVND